MHPSPNQTHDDPSEGATTSLWMSTLPPKQSAALPKTSAVDVCVIGAGIAGLSTAYECLSRGMTWVCRAHSALCPHLGGVVNWNAVEHSWDCPSHGSRFAALGRVLSGPSTRNLEDDPRDGV